MSYRIVFSPEAEEQLAALYIYISEAASPDIAFGYTEAIVKYCESLHTFPIRGTTRDDVRPGLRISNYSAKNQEALRHSIEQIEAGKIVTKTLDELRRME